MSIHKMVTGAVTVSIYVLNRTNGTIVSSGQKRGRLLKWK